MTTITRPKTTTASLARADAERLPWGWIVAALIVVIGLPASLALSEAWMVDASVPKSRRAPPEWLATQTVRATSGDGELVKARVALDVPDADTRAFLNSRSEQVKLLMQVGVAAHERGDANGPEHVRRLTTELRTRLNAFLEASDVAPVRDLVIQDLLVDRP